jgi:hypothetical protein
MDGSVHLPNMTPFDSVQTDADDLLTEAHAWADGTPVASQAQADEVSRLIEALRLNAKAADDARKEENRPHDEAKAAVQTKYAPLWADPKTKAPGKVFKAIDALKAALAPYLRKLDDEKREAARIAQEAADEAARKAREALQSAAPDNLAAQEQAEDVAKEAEAAQKAAKAAAQDKAHATGGSRAMGLRTRWTATLTDPQAAARHFWTVNPGAFTALLQKLADDDVRAGKRAVPGFAVTEERVL